jgi:carbamoyltransferase
MLTLGINKGQTLRGKSLRLGGVAVAWDGCIGFAIAEERVMGKKWAEGYDSALRQALKQSWNIFTEKQATRNRLLRLSDFDVVAVSTCCEGEQAGLCGHKLENHPHINTVNHHLSHASTAFFPSHFDSALICVIDGGGNTFCDESPECWWECSREQHSYYIGSGNSLELVDRDFFEPRMTGFGEIYRAFTYYLGWHSSRNAAKTMALAAYGSAGKVSKETFIAFKEGKLDIPVSNDPNDPVGMVERLGKAVGIDFGEPRSPDAEILPLHRNIAAYLQGSLERALLQKLTWLSNKYQVKDLCLAGGFALNCVANGNLARSGVFDRIYVPSVPGDEGQAIGNALWWSSRDKHQDQHYIPAWRYSKDVQLGPSYRVDSATTISLLKQYKLDNAIVFEENQLERSVAELINSGSTVCVFRGRSEAGPRALGQRSILGDPRGAETTALLNQLKEREWMQPFAPSILASDVNRYFDIEIESPFMSFAIPVRVEKRRKIAAVVHRDGTARVQTVSATEGSFLFNVLRHFKKLSGIPVVLNTSFNLRGQPIVEKPEEALKTFSKMSVNALVLERFLIVKNLSPDMEKTSLIPRLEKMEFTVLDGNRKESITSNGKAREIIRWIQKNTGQVVFVRGDFPLYGEFREWLVAGRKVTTIRFRKGGVEIPNSVHLPLFTTRDFYWTRKKEKSLDVTVKAIKYQRFGQLTEEDAERDGFKNLKELQDTLRRIYPRMNDNEWVTVYSIAPVRLSFTST